MELVLLPTGKMEEATGTLVEDKPQSPAPPESSTTEFSTTEPSSDANDLGADYDTIDDDEVGLGCQKEVTEHELRAKIQYAPKTRKEKM